MDFGVLAFEAYQFDRGRFMGFSFSFFPGFLRFLFNAHGYIPFSAGKGETLIVKTAAGGLKRTPSVESLNIFHPVRPFYPPIVNSAIPSIVFHLS